MNGRRFLFGRTERPLRTAAVELVFDELLVLHLLMHQRRKHVAGGVPVVRIVGTLVVDRLPSAMSAMAALKSSTVGRTFRPAGSLMMKLDEHWKHVIGAFCCAGLPGS
jgi:hypothetical protein